MTTGIVGHFVLGTYTGHRADGSADPFPDPARLHAALLHAAGQGSTAVVDDGALQPSGESLTALRWLENHPPSGIRMPESRPVAATCVQAYRKEGVLRIEMKQWKDKTTARAFSDSMAFNGPIGWCWNEEMPGPVRRTLELLCADVAYLGEVTSPVVLKLTHVDPTHLLDASASMFDAGGSDIRVPAPGRTDLLCDAHQAAHLKAPTIGQDRHASSELPAPTRVVGGGTVLARYKEPAPELSNCPWDQVILLTTAREIAPRDRVGWCTALHRALISRIGFGAPPLITGSYAAGVARPPNRLAIQYFDQSVLAHHRVGSHAFALCIPAGTEAAELAVLQRALDGMRVLKTGKGVAELHFDGLVIPGEAFWSEPSAGFFRTWRTNPVAIPETRAQRRRGPDGTSVRTTLADAALLSVALVWRDELNGPGRGQQWYRLLSENATERGVRIQSVQSVPTRDAARYVHKMPDGVIAQPYQAKLSLGTLASDTTLVAIGQSRHLGGGLLVPEDTLADLVDHAQETAQ